jgi:hypothetical protein
MDSFFFRVFLRVDGVPCTKGYRVRAVDEGMARGMLRGQTAIMGWEFISADLITGE